MVEYPVKIGYVQIAMVNAAPGVPQTPPPPVVLGSGSPYRRELLSRLLADFEVVSPSVDEAAGPLETPKVVAQRLARLKAVEVSRLRPAAVIIGGDQVAECGGRTLGKPGSADRAVAQLTACSGKLLTLHTAVHILGPQGSGIEMSHTDQTRLQFRTLTAEAIMRYVTRDRPLDCAGGFRFEGLGAALFSEVQTHDPTAIQGLPLLWLAQALEQFNLRVI